MKKQEALELLGNNEWDCTINHVHCANKRDFAWLKDEKEEDVFFHLFLNEEKTFFNLHFSIRGKIRYIVLNVKANITNEKIC